MSGPSNRRRFLRALAGVEAVAIGGCVGSDWTPTPTRPPGWTPTRTPTPEPRTYDTIAHGRLVEPAEDEWGKTPEPADARPEHLPALQAAVGPVAEVRVVDDTFDQDDYGFYGDVSEYEAREAVEAIGLEVNDATWDSGNHVRETMRNRVDLLGELSVELPPVRIAGTDSHHDLAYPHDVPGDTVRRVNAELRRMGLVVLSLGPPEAGRLWSVRPGTAALRETTVLIELTGDDVSWFLAAHDVPSDPGRYPLRVYLDGAHVATHRLTDADLDRGPRLADPEIALDLGDEFAAAGAYAALHHRAHSRVTIVEE